MIVSQLTGLHSASILGSDAGSPE